MEAELREIHGRLKRNYDWRHDGMYTRDWIEDSKISYFIHIVNPEDIVLKDAVLAKLDELGIRWIRVDDGRANYCWINIIQTENQKEYEKLELFLNAQ